MDFEILQKESFLTRWVSSNSSRSTLHQGLDRDGDKRRCIPPATGLAPGHRPVAGSDRCSCKSAVEEIREVELKRSNMLSQTPQQHVQRLSVLRSETSAAQHP
jgi:hypothetical protein